jgi:hypothetical protein
MIIAEYAGHEVQVNIERLDWLKLTQAVEVITTDGSTPFVLIPSSKGCTGHGTLAVSSKLVRVDELTNIHCDHERAMEVPAGSIGAIPARSFVWCPDCCTNLSELEYKAQAAELSDLRSF